MSRGVDEELGRRILHAVIVGSRSVSFREEGVFQTDKIKDLRTK